MFSDFFCYLGVDICHCEPSIAFRSIFVDCASPGDDNHAHCVVASIKNKRRAVGEIVEFILIDSSVVVGGFTQNRSDGLGYRMDICFWDIEVVCLCLSPTAAEFEFVWTCGCSDDCGGIEVSASMGQCYD